MDVSVWIAIGSVVIAGGSLVVAIAALRQTRKYFPRPHWIEPTWTFMPHQTSDSEPMGPGLMLTLGQMGPGDAAMVRGYVKTPHRSGEWRDHDTVPRYIEKGKTLTVLLSPVTGEGPLTGHTQYMEETYIYPLGDAVPGTYRVRLEWRQHDDPDKVKRQSFKYVLRESR
jgi:hypothetical protein